MVSITVLGAGTPTPNIDRWGSSFAVEIEDELLLFDCGPATTYKLVKAGFWPLEVNCIFFTHHHFDHNVDLPTFLLTRWDQSIGDEDALRIYGPALTEEITDGLIGPEGVFAPDLKARINHPGSQQIFINRGGVLPRPGPSVDATNVGPGFVAKGASWSVRSADAVHVQPYLDSLAYRVETEAGSIVFTGDTEPCESVVKLASGADIMFCMCYDSTAQMSTRGDLGGSGTTEAARMAETAGVSRLVLVHSRPELASHGPMEEAIGEVAGIYGGSVIFAEEMMRIVL